MTMFPRDPIDTAKYGGLAFLTVLGVTSWIEDIRPALRDRLDIETEAGIAQLDVLAFPAWGHCSC